MEWHLNFSKETELRLLVTSENSKINERASKLGIDFIARERALVSLRLFLAFVIN